jgi:hypothetical protein
MISEDMVNNYNDGKRIFINRLRYYPREACEEHMVSFKQLMYKDLGFNSKLRSPVDVKTAILQSLMMNTWLNH